MCVIPLCIVPSYRRFDGIVKNKLVLHLCIALIWTHIYIVFDIFVDGKTQDCCHSKHISRGAILHWATSLKFSAAQKLSHDILCRNCCVLKLHFWGHWYAIRMCWNVWRLVLYMPCSWNQQDQHEKVMTWEHFLHYWPFVGESTCHQPWQLSVFSSI